MSLSDRYIATANEQTLIGLVMKLTGGSANPAVVKVQIENARKRVAELNEPFEPFDVGQYIIEGASK